MLLLSWQLLPMHWDPQDWRPPLPPSLHRVRSQVCIYRRDMGSLAFCSSLCCILCSPWPLWFSGSVFPDTLQGLNVWDYPMPRKRLAICLKRLPRVCHIVLAIVLATCLRRSVLGTKSIQGLLYKKAKRVAIVTIPPALLLLLPLLAHRGVSRFLTDHLGHARLVGYHTLPWIPLQKSLQHAAYKISTGSSAAEA